MEDDDVPLNEVLGAKPKAPEGVSAFNLGKSGRSGAEMFEEENAAIAGEDLTVVLQFTDKEFSAQARGVGALCGPRSNQFPRLLSHSRVPTIRAASLCRSDEDGAHGRAAQAQGS